jgi:hypothetical protein
MRLYTEKECINNFKYWFWGGGTLYSSRNRDK